MSVKNNWIASLVFVVLLGVFIVLRMGVLQPKVVEQPSDYDLTEAIFTADKDSFSKLHVTNPSGSFTFVKQEEHWIYEERPETELDQALVNSFSWDYVNFKPSRIIEEQASSLETYGLDQPQASILITLKDGSETTFLLGNAVDGRNGYYFMKQEDQTVYLISTIEGDNLLRPLKYYRKTTLFSITLEELTNLTFQKDDTVYEIQQADGTLRMVSPYDRGIYKNSFTEALYTPLQELKIAEFYDDANPEECGLDHPAYTIQVSGTEAGDLLFIGKENEAGLLYAKWKSKDGVFGIGKDSLAFLDTNPLAYLELYAYLPNIDTVESFVGTINGANFSMKIQRSGDQEIYFFNDQEVQSNEWKGKFQALLNAEIIGFIDQNYETTEAAISYTAKKTDGTEDHISFFPMGERNFAVSINGKIDFYVSKNSVDKIIENFSK